MEDKEEKEVRVQRLVTPCSFSMDSNDARHYDAAPLICRVPMTSFGRATVFHIAQSTVQGCAQIFFFFLVFTERLRFEKHERMNGQEERRNI